MLRGLRPRQGAAHWSGWGSPRHAATLALLRCCAAGRGRGGDLAARNGAGRARAAAVPPNRSLAAGHATNTGSHTRAQPTPDPDHRSERARDPPDAPGSCKHRPSAMAGACRARGGPAASQRRRAPARRAAAAALLPPLHRRRRRGCSASPPRPPRPDRAPPACPPARRGRQEALRAEPGAPRRAARRGPRHDRALLRRAPRPARREPLRLALVRARRDAARARRVVPCHQGGRGADVLPQRGAARRRRRPEQGNGVGVSRRPVGGAGRWGEGGRGGGQTGAGRRGGRRGARRAARLAAWGVGRAARAGLRLPVRWSGRRAAALPRPLSPSPPPGARPRAPSYITCAVQALAAFSDWGWWLYATVPAYGGYKLWTGEGRGGGARLTAGGGREGSSVGRGQAGPARGTPRPAPQPCQRPVPAHTQETAAAAAAPAAPPQGFIYPNFVKAQPRPEEALDDKTRARLERADRRAERRRMKRF
jgi:hypothetical protein